MNAHTCYKFQRSNTKDLDKGSIYLQVRLDHRLSLNGSPNGSEVFYSIHKDFMHSTTSVLHRTYESYIGPLYHAF